MNRRITQDKSHGVRGLELRIKGVHVARMLVLVLLVLNGLLTYAILYSSHGLPGYRNQNEQVRDLEQRIVRLKEDNQRVFDRIQALKNDSKAQEKLVRQQLGWVRDNEIILEFPEKGNGTGGKSSSTKPFLLLK